LTEKGCVGDGFTNLASVDINFGLKYEKALDDVPRAQRLKYRAQPIV
jgi:hypothetical protein